MPSLTLIETSQVVFGRKWAQLHGKLTLQAMILEEPQIIEQVHKIVMKVASNTTNKDAALCECISDYDYIDLKPNELRVTEEELQKSHKNMEPGLLKALRQAIDNVRSYQEKIKIRSIPDWTINGVRLGARNRPLERVGVCIPGASAPLVSTVIMTVVPAQVAGVKEIAAISAPRPDCNNSVHPKILGICWELGVNEVYRCSGAHGVAALAFGTETIPKVDKIVGPSNRWGQLAKKEVYGIVDIDSYAGPSEVLIIADHSARPEWVAADLLSQAEHAPGSAVLLTDSKDLAQAVVEQVDIQMAHLDRAEETRKCVERFCLAVVTQDLAEAIRLANDFAAEHLQIQCRDSRQIAERIINAGAIFIGHYTPVATGDYYAGPSHTLPTGGSARFFGALNVNDFIKQTSIISYDEKALKQAAGAIKTIADAEGLDAHAKSATIRTNE